MFYFLFCRALIFISCFAVWHGRKLFLVLHRHMEKLFLVLPRPGEEINTFFSMRNRDIYYFFLLYPFLSLPYMDMSMYLSIYLSMHPYIDTYTYSLPNTPPFALFCPSVAPYGVFPAYGYNYPLCAPCACGASGWACRASAPHRLPIPQRGRVKLWHPVCRFHALCCIPLPCRYNPCPRPSEDHGRDLTGLCGASCA